MPLPQDLPFVPFSDRNEIRRTTNRLEHWEQYGRAYFVTFRLGDSLPRALLEAWEREKTAWLAHHPEPWSPETERQYHERFSSQIEQALDAGHGDCVLRQPEVAKMVGDGLNFFEGERCRSFAWVVMPNHVHALFAPLGHWSLEQLLHRWKSFTSNAINRHLQTTGKIWQKDYFDRLIRDAIHFTNCVRYIRRNPLKAGLCKGEYLLWESDLAKSIE